MAISIIHNKTIVYKDKKRPAVEVANTVEKPVKINQQELINDIYGEDKPIKAVDVDIKRQYKVATVDTNNLKSDVVNTKVNNKVAQLRRLRRGN